MNDEPTRDSPVTTAISQAERNALDLLAEADAVFIFRDDGLKTFAWLRGLSTTPADVRVKYGASPADGKRMPRHLTVKMGLSQKEFDAAVKRGQKNGGTT